MSQKPVMSEDVEDPMSTRRTQRTGRKGRYLPAAVLLQAMRDNAREESKERMREESLLRRQPMVRAPKGTSGKPKGGELARPHSKRLLKVAERDGWGCHLCLEPIDRAILAGPSRATLDHLHPRSFGGVNALANLKLAHKACNNKRGNRPLGVR